MVIVFIRCTRSITGLTITHRNCFLWVQDLYINYYARTDLRYVEHFVVYITANLYSVKYFFIEVLSSFTHLLFPASV